MPIITLTTDFGDKDHFVGAVKGALLSELPSSTIVDITHKISPFNIHETAYIIGNAYKKFPPGSIHIIGVDAEFNPLNTHIAVKYDGHYFIAANNGVLTLLCKNGQPEKIVETTTQDLEESNFSVLDVFVKVAARIARGDTLEVIGNPITKLKAITDIDSIVSNDQNQIKGVVAYIDNYGNVVTNITQKLFETVGKGRAFEVRARNHRFTQVLSKYSDIVNFNNEAGINDYTGRKLALFNSGGLLEIAIYRSNPETVGGASTLLGLAYRDTVTVHFEE